MKSFNLSDWALQHRSLVWYFMIVSAIAGAMAYLSLGREEDPSFTIKTMVNQAQWPGASLEDTILQVSERIEKKLEELETLDVTRTMTMPGQTTIYLDLKPTTKGGDVPATWVSVRNIVDDIKGQLPQGVVGPFFNDRFDDVYGNIYGFTSDGISQRQLSDYIEHARARVLRVPNVGRVELTCSFPKYRRSRRSLRVRPRPPCLQAPFSRGSWSTARPRPFSARSGAPSWSTSDAPSFHQSVDDQPRVDLGRGPVQHDASPERAACVDTHLRLASRKA